MNIRIEPSHDSKCNCLLFEDANLTEFCISDEDEKLLIENNDGTTPFAMYLSKKDIMKLLPYFWRFLITSSLR